MTILERLKSQGVDAGEIGLFSFSKASNRESVSRAAALYDCEPDELQKDGFFRTVHSAAYKLGDVSEGELITDNKESMEYLSQALDAQLGTRTSETEGSSVYVGGDHGVALNAWAYCRSTLTPLADVLFDFGGVPLERARKIITRYESAKRMDGRLDFVDLLLRFAGLSMDPRGGVTEEKPVGELPQLTHLLFDEWQDASALIQKCADRFVNSLHTEKATMVGDPFQSIYGFGGSSSEFLMNMEVDSQHIMPRSYRCCDAVMKFAEGIIRDMRRGYFDRKVQAADHDGRVHHHMDNRLGLMEIDANTDTLVIARTQYRVKEAAGVLAELGIPFAPVTRGEGPTVVSTACTVLHDLQRGEPVDGIDFARAVEKLPVNSKDGKILERGTKAKWKRSTTPEEIDVVFKEDLPDLGFTDHAVDMVTSGHWPTLITGGAKWVRSVRDHGVELTNNPRVRVGTIHSVKGEESDAVFVATGTSSIVEESKQSSDEKFDEEKRICYVAATRAKYDLHIMEADGPYSMLN